MVITSILSVIRNAFCGKRKSLVTFYLFTFFSSKYNKMQKINNHITLVSYKVGQSIYVDIDIIWDNKSDKLALRCFKVDFAVISQVKNQRVFCFRIVRDDRDVSRYPHTHALPHLRSHSRENPPPVVFLRDPHITIYKCHLQDRLNGAFKRRLGVIAINRVCFGQRFECYRHDNETRNLQRAVARCITFYRTLPETALG